MSGAGLPPSAPPTPPRVPGWLKWLATGAVLCLLCCGGIVWAAWSGVLWVKKSLDEAPIGLGPRDIPPERLAAETSRLVGLVEEFFAAIAAGGLDAAFQRFTLQTQRSEPRADFDAFATVVQSRLGTLQSREVVAADQFRVLVYGQSTTVTLRAKFERGEASVVLEYFANSSGTQGLSSCRVESPLLPGGAAEFPAGEKRR